MMKAVAAPLAAALVLTLLLAGCTPEPKELVQSAEYGQIGTGATLPGTAGGGTRTTNDSTINSGSYGRLPDFARDQPITGSVAPVTGPGYATAPLNTVAVSGLDQVTTGSYVDESGVAPVAYVPVPQGALGSAVRDHSFPANPNSPAQGGYYRPNSEPTTSVGPILPPFDAAPEYRAVPVDVPQRDTEHTVSGEH